MKIFICGLKGQQFSQHCNQHLEPFRSFQRRTVKLHNIEVREGTERVGVLLSMCLNRPVFDKERGVSGTSVE